VISEEDEGDVFSHGSAEGGVDAMIVEAWSDEELPKESRKDTTVQPMTKQWAQMKKDLVAIPEAETPSCKSKRRSKIVDENSLDRAEWIKAAWNLDFTSKKGNNSKSNVSFVHLSNENVIDKLQGVSISLVNSSDQIISSITQIKEAEIERMLDSTSKDMISEVFDKEEKEELENEEVDKLVLNSLCCEIMDEVMDLVNTYP
jgi:hypothetical protein